VVCRAAGRRTGGNSLPEYWQLGAKPCARVQALTCGGRPAPGILRNSSADGYANVVADER